MEKVWAWGEGLYRGVLFLWKNYLECGEKMGVSPVLLWIPLPVLMGVLLLFGNRWRRFFSGVSAGVFAVGVTSAVLHVGFCLPYSSGGLWIVLVSILLTIFGWVFPDWTLPIAFGWCVSLGVYACTGDLMVACFVWGAAGVPLIFQRELWLPHLSAVGGAFVLTGLLLLWDTPLYAAGGCPSSLLGGLCCFFTLLLGWLGIVIQRKEIHDREYL